MKCIGLNFRILFSFIVLFCLSNGIGAQISFEKNEESSIIIGGFSPFILDRGSIEISNSSSLTSFWNKFNLTSGSISLVANTSRFTLFQNRTSVNYGFSGSRLWDLGMDLTYTRIRNDDIARNSPFEVFTGDDINTNSGLSLVGVKARVSPFISVPGLVFQGSIRFPIANGDVLRRSLNTSVLEFNLNSTYYQSLSYITSIYFQGGWTFRPSKSSDESGPSIQAIHAMSGAGFVIFNTWSQRFFILPGLSYGGTFQKSARSNRLLQRSHAVLAELVVQFKFTNTISLNLQQSYPLLFESYTPSIEFERRSFSQSAISLLVVI